MKENNKLWFGLSVIVMLIIISSCNGCPKPITTADNENSEKGDVIFPEETSTSVNTDDLHIVTVKEILPASKYLYLNVNEGNEQFWIAVVKQEVNVGESYYYRGGLLKTNFESKEYNKVFEEIYLVSDLIEANHGNNHHTTNSELKPDIAKDQALNSERKIEKAGSVKIAELVNEPKKYEGKIIQISGECVKINPNIMKRNWIHIRDGSKDDYDLVITSNTYVAEGTVITMRAVVSLNKDFGAGYKYDIILENGTIVP